MTITLGHSPSGDAAAERETGDGTLDSMPVRRDLYASHLLSSWGDRMWEFSIVIAIMSLYKHTLLPAAVFGISENVVGLLCGGAIGQWVGRTDRYQVIKVAYAVQNSCILLAALCLIALFRGYVPPGMKFHIVFGAAVVFGSLSKLGNSASNISVEKEWTKKITGGVEERLIRLNAGMLRIDLVCKILAPTASGIVSSLSNIEWMIVIIAIWNLILYPLEVYFLGRVYKRYEVLQEKPVPATQDGEAKTSTWSAWKIYATETPLLISLAYVFLYGSLLNWGAVFTAYMKWKGSPDWLLALGRGVAACGGVFATFAVKPIVRWFGLYRVALWTGWLFCCTVVPTFLYFQFPTFSGEWHLGWVIALIFVPLAFSRIFLWTFDMAAIQIVQTTTRDIALAPFLGVQQSMISTLYICSFLQGVIWPDPQMFHYPAFVSCGFTLTTALLTTLHYFLHGRHHGYTALRGEEEDEP